MMLCFCSDLSSHEQIFMGGSQWYRQRGNVCVERWSSSSKWSAFKLIHLITQESFGWWTIFWQSRIQLFEALFCSVSSVWRALSVLSDLCRTFFPGRRTSRITGRIMKTVFTSVAPSTRTQGNSTTCPAHPRTPSSARKVRTIWGFPVWSVFYLFYCLRTMGLIHETRAERICVNRS